MFGTLFRAQRIRLWFNYSPGTGIHRYSRYNGQEITESEIRVNCKIRHNSYIRVIPISSNAALLVLGSIKKSRDEIVYLMKINV